MLSGSIRKRIKLGHQTTENIFIPDICRFVSQENAELIFKRRYTISLQQGLTWVVHQSLQLRCSILININKKHPT